MNKPDTSDIVEEIAHHQKMLKVLKRQLRERELTAIQHGLTPPLSIVNEIHAFSDRIQEHQAEIARLESQRVEDKLTLTEARYRLLIAEAWNTPRGEPNVVGRLQIEVARLQEALPIHHSQQLEHDVRTQLADEAIIETLYPKDWQGSGFEFKRLFSQILKICRLNLESGISFVIDQLLPVAIESYSTELDEELNEDEYLSFTVEENRIAIGFTYYFVEVNTVIHPIGKGSVDDFINLIFMTAIRDDEMYITNVAS